MMKRKLQIFVSSTFADLTSDRQAAVSAILKAGHIPAGMELFAAGDRSQMETIKSWIDESDGYMLILGGRYGSIESTTGISYTELEYDYAVQQGKPLFAAVITEEALAARVLVSGVKVIEQEDPKALKLFRDKVLDNISSFFADEKDIKLCVHESLAEMRDNPNVVGWVPASEVEDTRPLHEEIAKLRSDNAKLLDKQIPATPKDSIKSNKISEDEVQELIDLLSSIDIKLPEAITGKPDLTNDLFSLFISNSELLVNGVTNRTGASATIRFLYFNVCPKLTVHGLVTNEKIASVTYRRSYVNERGIAFLAAVAKRVHKKQIKLIPPKVAETETSDSTDKPD